MRSLAKLVICCLLITCLMSSVGWAVRVMGKVTSVDAKYVTCSFPTPVEPNAMMIVLTGEGESVAATAVSSSCTGAGPYTVYGSLLFVADSINMTAGKDVYVNSVDTKPAPSVLPVTPAPNVPARAVPLSRAYGYPPTHDLKLYYYAAGQTVGYGTLGLGYERTLRVSKGLALEVDGGVAAVGSVNGENPKVVDTSQLIKNANGRVRFDFSNFIGFYSGYRWSEARGDDAHWADVVDKLSGKDFIAPSKLDGQTVMQQGLEYGVTLRPFNSLAISAGFIPQYRSDYGTFGVRTQPGYTGELRFGTRAGGLRLRGIKSDDYWQADLGITIR